MGTTQRSAELAESAVSECHEKCHHRLRYLKIRHDNGRLDIKGLVERDTVFLFGPRQTGKSTYIRHEILPMAQKIYSLRDHGLLFRLKADPTRLRQEVEAQGWSNCLLVIDEVQKCPEVLDVVHELIEERRIRFLLTGSSARALKRSGLHLLGGRGLGRTLHPFIYRELKDLGFDLKKQSITA